MSWVIWNQGRKGRKWKWINSRKRDEIRIDHSPQLSLHKVPSSISRMHLGRNLRTLSFGYEMSLKYQRRNLTSRNFSRTPGRAPSGQALWMKTFTKQKFSPKKTRRESLTQFVEATLNERWTKWFRKSFGNKCNLTRKSERMKMKLRLTNKVYSETSSPLTK